MYLSDVEQGVFCIPKDFSLECPTEIQGAANIRGHIVGRF